MIAVPELVCDDIGYLVSDTGTHLIHVMPMIYNWRVTRTPKDDPSGADRAWCYYGTGEDVFVKAVLAAHAWDGADDTAPAGWDKNPMTGQYARPGTGQEVTSA
jgi:hypothetical protein